MKRLLLALVMLCGPVFGQIQDIPQSEAVGASRQKIVDNFNFLNAGKASLTMGAALPSSCPFGAAGPVVLFVRTTDDTLYVCESAGWHQVAVPTGNGGSGAWGAISGRITDQADLAAALAGKAAATHNHAASDIASGVLPMSRLSSSGTCDATSVLWGDGRCAAPPAEEYTASNQGTAGVGPYKDILGGDIRFFKLNAASNRLSIALNGTDHIDFDVNAGNIPHQSLSGTGVNTHAQIDSHIVSVNNPHATTAAQVSAVPLADKGTVNGVATLDGATKIPIAQLPTGSSGTTVALGNDARLSDARTPTSHAATHKNGGADEIGTATAAANAIPKAGASGTLAAGWLPVPGATSLGGVQSKAAASHYFLTGISPADGSVSVAALGQTDLPVMSGDSGSGGAQGAVPAPAVGDSTKFLTGAGTWSNVTKINGTSIPTNASADQVLGTTAGATGSWIAVPNCGDSAHALAYSTAAHTYSCQPITAGAGGSAGQLQYNNSGALSGVTVGGDGTLNAGTGALTVTKTNGTAFANSATVDATNATNIGSGTLTAARLPASLSSTTSVNGTTIPSSSTLMTTVTSLVAAQEPAHTGDVTNTAGSLALTAAKINGTAVPTNAAADTVLGTTASATGSWMAVPSCIAAGGTLQYNTTTHAFACHTIAAGDIPAALSSTTSVNGTTIPSGATLMTAVTSLVAAQEPAHTGDVTNSAGSLALTAGKINGTAVPTNAAADQTLVTTASATGSWASVPNCGDSSHGLAYSTGSHSYSCQSITGTAGGLADPGSNGLLKRTSLNTTAAAVAGTDYMATNTNVATTQMPALTGDVTTGAGTVATTAAKINGTAVPTNAAADTVLGTTASATGSWMAVPSCIAAGGTLQYNTSTHAFACHTIAAGDVPAALSSTTSVNGTTIPSSSTLMTTATSLVAAQEPAHTGDVTNTAGTLALTAAKINGTAVPTNAAADTVLGTTASATGSWMAVPSCIAAGGTLQYNTTTHAFACHTIAAGDLPAALSSTTSVNGTTIPSGATLMTAATSLVAAQEPAHTGDVTNSAGSLALTAAKINGTAVPTNAAADQTLVTTASATGSWASVPNCVDSSHGLAYSTATHSYSCQSITGSGLADPGSNGLLKRTSLNTKAAAVAGTDYMATNTNLAATQMPALAGDVTTSAGSVATTLATVNGSPGNCGDATHVCQITTNGKGLVTSQTALVVSGSGQAGAYASVTPSGSSITFTASSNTANSFAATLGASGPYTSSLASAASGQVLAFKICQDSTGGRQFSWPTGFSAAAAVSAVASACTKQTFFWDGSTAVPIGPATVDSGPSVLADGAMPAGNPAAGTDYMVPVSGQLQLKDSSGNLNSTLRTKGSRDTNKFVTNVDASGIQQTAALATADLPAAHVTRTKVFSIFDFTDASDSGKLQFEEGTAIHLTRIYGSIMGATNIVVNLDKRSEGTPNTDSGAHLLSSDLTLTTSGANTTAFANGSAQCGGTSSCAIAARTPVVLTVASQSGGAAGDAARVVVEYTVD